MTKVKYWLLGVIYGLVAGIFFGLFTFFCASSEPGSSCKSFIVVPYFILSIIKSNDILNSIITASDFVEIIFLVIPYIIFGGIIGWIYGKYKYRKV